jgi:tetratricopeptide (TPR) repeat protein
LGRAALVSFPITALECLAYLADRSPGGLLALVGDRGFTNPEDSEVLSVVEPTRHGSVSLPVNFHALGEWFLRRGGAACHPDHRARSFNVSMFALPGSPGSPTAPWPRTEAAYRAGAATRDPDTFFTVKKAVQAQYDSLSVPEAIAFLRLSHWDADIFDALFLHLVERLSSEPLDDGGRRELVAAVGHVWEGYYPVRDNDLAFKVGSVLYAAGAYREALTFFDRSLAANDAAVDAWLNRAVCHHMLGERDEALACVGRALELAPGLDQAVTLLQDLLA